MARMGVHWTYPLVQDGSALNLAFGAGEDTVLLLLNAGATVVMPHEVCC